MSAIVPFDFSAPAPVAQRRRESRINQDVISHTQGFPSISIKGKVFTIVKGDERKPLMREIDGDMVPVPSLRLAVVRANTRSRVFYAKSYAEGDSDGAKPTCFSHDGAAPDAQSESPQSRTCQLCPHAVWGSKVSTDGNGAKGTACSPNTRIALADPNERLSDDKPKHTVYLLRVPAGSRANFSEAVSKADQAGKDYNQVVFKIGFDPTAPSPKLTFEPCGLLTDEAGERIAGMFDDQQVKDIVGHPSVPVAERVPAQALPAPAPAQGLLSADEIDAIPAAPAPKPRPAPAPAPALGLGDLDDDAPAPAPAPAPAARARRAPAAAPAAPAADAASLLGGLAGMLGMADD